MTIDPKEVDDLMANMRYPKLAAYAVHRIRDYFNISHEQAIAIWQKAKIRLKESQKKT